MSLKKIIAGVAVTSIVAMNLAHAATTLTGSVTGGATNTDVIWDGTYNGYNNATGSTTVQVSAIVAPILTMSVSSNSLALGTLGTAGYNSGSTTVTVATNASNGTTVNMASAGLRDSTISKQIGVTPIGATPQTAAGDFYKVTTAAVPAIVDGNPGIATPGGTDMLATQQIYSSSTPVATAATTVTVGAKIATTTEAGNYSDTLTFTVTGNF